MSEKNGMKLVKVSIASALFIAALVSPKIASTGVIQLQSQNVVPYIKIGAMTLAWLIAGFEIIKSFLCNLKRRKNIFDENFLMTIASIGALCLGNFAEAAAVMILYELGEYFQDRAVKKSNKSIAELVDIRALYANVEREGKIEKVQPDEVMIGEQVIIKPGEIIPVDGFVTAGQSTVNVAPLTGESMPRNIQINDYVYSGCINLTGILKVRTDKFYLESASTKMMNLVETAQKNKSKTEKFITKFAKVYTPIVIILAVLLALSPLYMHMGISFKQSIERALTFLVIACPCAFVLSIPLTFFSGIGIASKWGILVKGGEYLEALSNANLAVFDKTGTLTVGNHRVNNVILATGVTKEEIIETVLKVEANSNHPIALAIKKAFGYKGITQIRRNTNVTEIAGKGMWLTEGSGEILVGNKELMLDYNIPIFENKQEGTKIYVAKNKKYLGCIVVSDDIKQSAKILISKLKGIGITSVMLTGDIKDNAAFIAKATGIEEWYFGLLPEDKIYKLEELIKNNKKNKKVIYTGDGINDAPVLMRSDVGIAMGAIGSQAAIEAADVVVTDDNLAKIFLLVNIAKKTVQTAKENIILALGVKALFLILGAFGFMTMWLAIFADTGVTLIAVLNALKILKIKNTKL